jgi:hypothetical protein
MINSSKLISLGLILFQLLSCSKKKQERQQITTESQVQRESEQPVHIGYGQWDDAWTPKREELPKSLYWNYFDSSRVKHFTPAELDALAQHGLFVEPVPPRRYLFVDDMVDLYGELVATAPSSAYSIVPVFISSDLLLHVYHLLFDRALQDMERRKFRPRLAVLTTKLYERSKQDYQAAVEERIKNAALKNMAYFAIASKLLTSKVYLVKKDFEGEDWHERFASGEQLDAQKADRLRELVGPGWTEYLDIHDEGPLAGEVLPPAAQAIVDAELALILAAEGFAKSPLFDREWDEDYSQYRPRGHYTIYKALESYFRAMMWYGRMPFAVKSEQATLQAILMTLALQDPELEKTWAGLTTPLEFLIGESEDLGVRDYRRLVAEVYGENPALNDLADSEKVALFREKADGLPEPRIAKVKYAAKVPAKAFHLMGQRFVPDAEILSKLTMPRVGTPDRPRFIPKSLDVMAVLGSSLAETMLEQDKTDIPNYADSLRALKDYYARAPEEKWQRTTYWCWLNTLRALLQEKDQGFPFFMRGPYWQKKSLLTASASWAELKHDTILYTEQAYAELGEGDLPPPPPQPKSYVEPDLEFFNRLTYLAEKTLHTLEAAQLLSDEYRQRMAEFLAKTKALREIVRKELLNEILSSDEYDWITRLASDFELIVEPLAGDQFMDERSKRMAIVSDVHTDAWNKQVLNVAVGTPQRIYVAVKDKSGGQRVTVGYIFSFYEFPHPMAQRMTDEEWQELAYGERELSDKEPVWIKELRIAK